VSGAVVGPRDQDDLVVHLAQRLDVRALGVAGGPDDQNTVLSSDGLQGLGEILLQALGI